ncbi:MAG: glycosyltransferase family 2 protein [Oscillospiraceae bacterium]|nr:glycosyltransferase family 2 protein [Oscillospiraceae bacterium]
MKTVFLVVPCYNEEDALPETARQLHQKLSQLKEQQAVTAQSRILFVDDGSKDKTWEIIENLNAFDPDSFDGVKLSRNEGHQKALLAGLMEAKQHCDAAISLDADLQDDINAVDEMIQKMEEGCEIVYGVRSERETDSAFKRNTAHGFYKLMKLMGVELVYDHADYRLMTRTALDGLAEYHERNLFLRGIIPMIGYKTDKVFYKRGERTAGESKYPLKKMLSFALEGITSLSIRPIRFITALGILIFALSIIMLVYSFIRYITGQTVAGWTSIVFSVWAIGGLQLLAIGVIGEYVGKIYLETKHRPQYFIEKSLHKDE